MMPSALYSCLVLKMKNLILAALSQKSLSVGIVASAVFFGTTSHALASVLIAGSADPSYLNDVQAKIAGTGLISGSVDILDVSSSTPTLAQLQAYDAVLSFSDYGFADTTTFGNVLADYVDAGGGVVQATFSFYNGYDLDIGGRWKAQNYNVWQLGQQNNPGNLTLGTIYDPSNPILAGVTSFNGGSASFYNTVGSFNPGAVAVADWSNGAPLIAVNTSTFAGKIAGLNFYPPSSDARPDFWLSSTDGARLMANSLNFVTKQVPEPNSLLGLFAIGTLGAASTLKRKLKPSKSTEKQTTKVG